MNREDYKKGATTLWLFQHPAKALCIVSLSCISAALLPGCSRKNEAADSPRNNTSHARQVIRSTTDLRRLLIPALGTNEIVVTLGEPSWKEDLSKGEEEWHYSLPAFPADDAMRGSLVAGVAVGITNGRLANWGCIYVGSANDGITRKQTVIAGDKGQTESSILRLFLVRSDPIAGGRFIDTERLPKLGFVEPTATLVIRRLKKVTLDERVPSEGQSRTNWSFGIFLTQEDAAKLEAITAANISTKLLIMVGDEPVSAPRIVAPLEMGSFVIECQERSLMESVKKQLAEMERQSQ